MAEKGASHRANDNEVDMADFNRSLGKIEAKLEILSDAVTRDVAKKSDIQDMAKKSDISDIPSVGQLRSILTRHGIIFGLGIITIVVSVALYLHSDAKLELRKDMNDLREDMALEMAALEKAIIAKIDSVAEDNKEAIRSEIEALDARIQSLTAANLEARVAAVETLNRQELGLIAKAASEVSGEVVEPTNIEQIKAVIRSLGEESLLAVYQMVLLDQLTHLSAQSARP